MTDDLADAPRRLRELDPLPDTTRCVFASGSVVRGWGNPGSDIDLYVVSDGRWQGAHEGEASVALPSATVLSHAVQVGDRRWELNYWTVDQVDRLVAKFGWELFADGSLLAQPVSEAELKCAERLTYGVGLLGGEWLDERRAGIEASAFGAALTTLALGRADDHIEDLAGQLQVGDVHSAVLSARFALGWAVDAMLAGHGQRGLEQKWRGRRFQGLTEVPTAFWSDPVRIAAGTLPLTHTLTALRNLESHAPAADVVVPAMFATVAGVCWLGAAHVAYGVVVRRIVRAGTVDLAE